MIHNVLIVDDNSSLLAIHGGVLLRAGYGISIAQNMSSVSTQLRFAAPSLVITELAFPESAQSDAVSLIRRVATLRPGIPILALTSNANPASHREARSMGVWDIIVKPILSTELLSLTKNILDEAYSERSRCLIT